MFLRRALFCVFLLSAMADGQQYHALPIQGYYPAAIGLQGGGIGLQGGGLQGGGLIPIGLVGGGAGGGLGVGGVGLGVGGGGGGFVGGGGLVGGGGGGGLVGVQGGGIGVGGPLLYKQGYGGEAVEKSQFDQGKKNLNDQRYEKVDGKKGEEIKHGQQGYQQGNVLEKEAKGNNGYYQEAEGGKKVHEDGKKYQGGQHYQKGGKEGEEKKFHKGHKKGHVIKGYKNSHHKDETGRTEEYYDEENDEGQHLGFNGQQGQFGANGASSFKGAHEDEQFAKGEKKKEGHYSQENLVGKEGASSGKFGEQKYANQGAVFGAQNGAGLESLLGHHEQSKFYKHVPFFG